MTRSRRFSRSCMCHCAIPMKYLGLPLSIFRLKKEDLQPLVDKIASRLPTWKSNQMNSMGRITMVNSVLSAIPIYLLVAIDAPRWIIKGIDKIRRGFLWAGKAEAKGGCCWGRMDKSLLPKEYGGLGVPNLELMGIALRSRWSWMQRTCPNNTDLSERAKFCSSFNHLSPGEWKKYPLLGGLLAAGGRYTSHCAFHL